MLQLCLANGVRLAHAHVERLYVGQQVRRGDLAAVRQPRLERCRQRKRALHQRDPPRCPRRLERRQVGRVQLPVVLRLHRHAAAGRLLLDVLAGNKHIGRAISVELSARRGREWRDVCQPVGEVTQKLARRGALAGAGRAGQQQHAARRRWPVCQRPLQPHVEADDDVGRLRRVDSEQ
eukprot:83654-Chlamydomonas_euryale.AAC.1